MFLYLILIMLMKNENLFATPIWTHKLDKETNDNIKREIVNYQKNTNLFDLDTSGIKKLKNTIIEAYDSIAIDHHFMQYYGVLHGRVNVIGYGSNDTPHNHIGKVLVGVYYVQTGKNMGDILLHDPRGGVNWQNLNFDPQESDPSKTCRTYHRIKPEDGYLILFPSYLVHSVETNLTQQDRISIVINI
jgi:uncharacterized protein (TIGR02466 family)